MKQLKEDKLIWESLNNGRRPKYECFIKLNTAKFIIKYLSTQKLYGRYIITNTNLDIDV